MLVTQYKYFIGNMNRFYFLTSKYFYFVECNMFFLNGN